MFFYRKKLREKKMIEAHKKRQILQDEVDIHKIEIYKERTIRVRTNKLNNFYINNIGY